MPAQLVSNPRNKKTTPVYGIEPEKSVDLHAMDCKNIQTRYGKIINSPPLVITEMIEENEIPSIVVPKKDIDRKEKEPDSNTTKTPFPERFKEAIEIKESELVQELRKLNIEIPLLQAIKDIPELNKLIKILCLKNLGRKKQYPKTIKVDGKLVDLLVGKLLHPKYGDPGSLVIFVSIGKKDVHNVLIDLGAAINVMTVNTLKTSPLT
ncbi:hypothetical protein KI387_015137, partial [Taxus chinensis]